jgi:hypothetical protein
MARFVVGDDQSQSTLFPERLVSLTDGIQLSRRKPSSGIEIENKFPTQCVKRHFTSIASRPKFATFIMDTTISGSDCEQA